MLESVAIKSTANARGMTDTPTSPASGKGYRSDIDGLRAVAVLSVVIYHLNKAWLPGGYVGVDIFFVISGFLITQNIWGEMTAGKFSLKDFYFRRIRRIAPAFLVMAVATMLIGSMLLLPDDLQRLGRSALWGAFSLSNVFFWRYLDTGYFADSSDQEPLLHTWSLGVEEQFYFIWPAILVLLLMLSKRRGSAIGVAALICVASFAYGEIANDAAQKFAYYMLPARAGELMVGALLALLRSSNGNHDVVIINSGWLRESTAILGFGLIGYSLFHLDDASPFPGINAVYPCVGAALLILAGGLRSRIVATLLTFRPVVFIGLISYSLYLWHWPILAFIRYFYGTIGLAHGAAAVIGMLALSVLSYRYVETPARHWRARPFKQVITLYLLPSVVLCVGAGTVVSSGGLKNLIESSKTYSDGLARVEGFTAPAYKFPYNCQLSAHDPGILRAPRCIVPVPAGQAISESGMLLWGDSEAAHYIGVIGQIAKRGGFSFRNATHSSCPPVFGGEYGVAPYKAGCDRFRPYMQAAILSGEFRTVIISGAWAIYDRNPAFRGDLEHTIKDMTAHGISVVLIGQAPVFQNYSRECDLRGLRVGGISCRQRLAVVDTGDSAVNDFLESLAKGQRDVSYLDVREIICRDGVCSPYLDGRPIYYDGSHLSMDGSWFLGEKLVASPDYARWSAVLNKNSAAPVAGEARHATAAQATVLVEVAAFMPRVMPAILGGYSPSFPYHVRSEKNLDSIIGPAGVVLEFWGIDEAGVIDSVERDFSRLGFKRVGRQQVSGNVVRLDFEKPGFPRVSVNVGPLGNLRPQAPNAEGIAYIHW